MDGNKWIRLMLGAASTVVVVAFAVADAIWPRIRSSRAPAPPASTSPAPAPADTVAARTGG